MKHHHVLKAEKVLFSTKYSKMIKIPENCDWINVDSAFGGLAIYRKEAIVHGQYVGINSLGGQICEHVPFHDDLISKGFRIFINPKLINATYTEHSNELRLVHRLGRQTRTVLKYSLKRMFGHSLKNIKQLETVRKFVRG
jgi:hypothetical protein